MSVWRHGPVHCTLVAADVYIWGFGLMGPRCINGGRFDILV